MWRLLCVTAAAMLLVVSATGCGDPSSQTGSGDTSQAKAEVSQYLSDVGPSVRQWAKATLLTRQVQQSLSGTDPAKVRENIDRFIVALQRAEARLRDVTPPARFSDTQVTFSNGVHRTAESADEFRVEFTQYLKHPTSSTAKLVRLWNSCMDDGAEMSLAFKAWLVPIAAEAQAMNVPEPQWLKETLSAFKGSL